MITVQLPIYNEMYVADRLIDSVCELDYPRELLEIQVLDDSVDETGRRFRLPKGRSTFDAAAGPLGPERAMREVCTERDLSAFGAHGAGGVG